MGGKSWYQEDDIYYTKFARDYLQKYIDLYCWETDEFKVPEDITPDNFKNFLEIILRQYRHYNITALHIMYLGDAFDFYFGNAFEDEFNEEYPNFPKYDRRELAFYISDNAIQCFSMWFIIPEDVPFILECLNAPESEIIYMYDKLEEYFKQFDRAMKGNAGGELANRWDLINKQRIEAIQTGQPLPIKPMGIPLDLCYKKEK